MLMHGGLICIALRLSVCDWTEIHWTIIHITKSIAPRAMQFGQNMASYDSKVDLEGQGQRSRPPGQKS